MGASGLRAGASWALLGTLAAAAAGGSASQAADKGPIPPERLVEVAVDRPWHTCPKGPDRSLRYYPERALRREIEGEANIQCRFDPEGNSTACVWLTESRPDVGFGPAAEKLGCLVKMKGKGPTPGEPFVVQIPMTFKLPR
jgi:protein TonB